jgi:hypothetical protein
MFSDQVNNLVNMDDPNGTLEEYRNAISDVPLHEDMLEGIYCWLCENGSIPMSSIGDFTTAVFIMFPDDPPRGIFAQWLFNAIQCSKGPFLEMVSHGLLDDNCGDCAALDCADWTLALQHRYTHEFNLNDTAEHWFPATDPDTEYYSGHGYGPLGATGFNSSCIGIYSDTVFFRMEQLEIGLEAAYPEPVHIAVNVDHFSGGGAETFEDHLAAGQDYFTIPWLPDVDYTKITILIERDDSSPCTTAMETLPYIRYVIVHGIGLDPWL